MMPRNAIVLGALLLLSATAVGAWLVQAPAGTAPMTRVYYVAADEVEWDYAPSGMNQMTGKPFDEFEQPWMEPGPHHTGRKALKALYREYTDSTFTTLKPRPPEWEHLGFLGPVIRGVVGDTIKVVFRNNARFPASVHPHGVFYNKDSEGALYEDGTADGDKADDAVPQGGTHTYVWPVPERAGPTHHETSTAFWMYHSHTDELRDIAAGLFGPMIITRRSDARPDGTPRDVDRELVAGFIEVDENHSWYLQDNIDKYATKPEEVTIGRSPFGDIIALPEFGTYFKETINGFSYGHTPGMTVKMGERVRWYLMASTNFEMHSPHWHGNVVVADGMRLDVAGLLPMGMMVADMVPDNPGRWFFHCHLAGHMRIGMQAYYTVEPATQVAAR
jgi:FtsP/CotA-like multicopper oxidase with cupredoxin domain